MNVSEHAAEIVETTAAAVIDSAVKIHIELGPGLLESVYETVLSKDLRDRGLIVVRQRAFPFTFRNITFESGFRLDLFVNDCVVIEVKSVEALLPVHTKQVLTYLRLLDLPLGLLINFGGATLKSGLRRIKNGYWSSSFSCLRANNEEAVHSGVRTKDREPRAACAEDNCGHSAATGSSATKPFQPRM